MVAILEAKGSTMEIEKFKCLKSVELIPSINPKKGKYFVKLVQFF